MQNFSLETSIKLSKSFKEIAEKRYPIISEFIYNDIAQGTGIFDTIFLHAYMSKVATNYQAIRESVGSFSNRKEVREFFDILSCITNYSLYNYNKSQLIILALSYFINSFLKIIFADADFFVAGIANINSSSNYEYKLFIEPILKDKILDKDCDNAFNIIKQIFSMDEPNRKVSISIFKSNNWVSDMTDEVEIIDDNLFVGFFEKNPFLYCSLFEKRKVQLKKDFNIDTKFEPFKEKFNNEFETEKDFGSYEEMQYEEFEENEIVNNESELNFYDTMVNSFTDALYENILKHNDMIFIGKHDIDENFKTNIPALREVLPRIDDENKIFNEQDFFNIIKKHYSDKEENPDYKVDEIVEENVDDDVSIHFNQFPETYEPTFDSNGWTKYVPDMVHKNYRIEVSKLVSYLEETTQIFIEKSNKPLNDEIIGEMLKYYKKDDYFNFNSTVNMEDENIFILANLQPKTFYKPFSCLLTLNKEYGIIENIRYNIDEDEEKGWS